MADYVSIHGQLMNTDELYHWKYIDKKKVNGKWRYIYNDNNEVANAKKKLDASYHKLKGEEAELEYAKSRTNRAKASTRIGENLYSRVLGSDVDKEIGKLTLNEAVAEQDFLNAKDEYRKVKTRYAKTKIKHIAVGAVAKGIAAIKNLFSIRRRNK